MKYFETDICVWSVSWADHQLSCPPDRFPAVSGSGLPDLRQNKPKFRLVQQGRAGQRKGEQWGLRERGEGCHIRPGVPSGPQSAPRDFSWGLWTRQRWNSRFQQRQSDSESDWENKIILFSSSGEPKEKQWRSQRFGRGSCLHNCRGSESDTRAFLPTPSTSYQSEVSSVQLAEEEINLSQSEFLLYLNSRASWSDGTKRIYCINTCMNKIKMKITLTPPHSIRQPLQMTRNTDLMLQLPTIMIREGI